MRLPPRGATLGQHTIPMNKMIVKVAQAGIMRQSLSVGDPPAPSTDAGKPRSLKISDLLLTLCNATKCVRQSALERICGALRHQLGGRAASSTNASAEIGAACALSIKVR